MEGKSTGSQLVLNQSAAIVPEIVMVLDGQRDGESDLLVFK